MTKFYDTCSLLLLQEDAFKEKFLVSSITLSELESIKTSTTKDEEIKYAARHLLHLFNENEGKYEVIRYNTKYDEVITEAGLILNNDSRIIATAYWQGDIIFNTADMACKEIAKSLGLKTEYALSEREDNYCGFKEFEMFDEELATFYSESLKDNINCYSLKENEYLLIKNNGNIVDKYKWKDNHYEKIPYYVSNSDMFGKINPKDDYQQIALDSLNSNQITVLRGKAGSGKSYLAMGYLMSQLEHGKIDRIVIFANPVPVRGAAKLGFYPGDKDQKLLDSQIGNFLATKLGSITEVEKMISDGTLILVPCVDCRGMDLSGMNAGVYVTEAQNFSRDMMKLILQRVGEDSKVVIDGDDRTQVDLKDYAGSNNGLRALSKAFRGTEVYGEVTLNNIYRSRIAEIADNL